MSTRCLRRLEQTLYHVQPRPTSLQWSLVQGPTEPKLLEITLGGLLSFQSLQYGDHECLVFPWTGSRWTYADLDEETDRVARGLLATGIQEVIVLVSWLEIASSTFQCFLHLRVLVLFWWC